MFNVRPAGGHLYGKQLFTWLSMGVSLMASFVMSFIPLDVLDEIWDLIESVSEGFLTYSLNRSITFGTTKICSRQGWFELMGVNHSVRSGGIIGVYFRFFNTKVCCVFSLEPPHRGHTI